MTDIKENDINPRNVPVRVYTSSYAKQRPINNGSDGCSLKSTGYGEVIPDATGEKDLLTRGINRRKFVKTGMAAIAGLIMPSFYGVGLASTERRLLFQHTHTGERLSVCYWKNGEYIEEGMVSINRFFRDFRTGEIKRIDTGLIDLIYTISETVGHDVSFDLVSGYRSPETNEKLRKNSSGVARKSLHLMGQAADIRVPGLQTSKLRAIAIDIGMGGVGYYPESDFVHVDIGRVRQW